MVDKVIFLDIDGPVIPPKNTLARVLPEVEELKYDFYGLTADFLKASKDHTELPDPISVILITHLAQSTNSKIVISSIWRSYGYDQFCNEFKGFGFDPKLLHDDWCTTQDVLPSREEEVLIWLKRNPQVKSFVTIDDEPLDFDNHIQVCSANGFLIDNYNQAYEILTGEETEFFGTDGYNQASVDFMGPRQIINDCPKVKRFIERQKARKEKVTRSYEA